MSNEPGFSRHFVSQLFASNYNWLCSRVRRQVGCPANAEDIAAETFLRVLTLPDPASLREPRAFLSTIARHLIYDTWRRRDLESAYLQSLADVPEALHPSPEEHLIMVEALVSLDRMLDSLPGQGKAAFILRQFGNLTFEQIGERLGISAPRVHQYVAQAYRHCLQVLQPL
ncbi:sigma-70 family RNA polymerase sigma factor [Pseudomonas entomophila]|uniref:sigma-70 family RNA polymerase sigma factor n=1 Tax=Pseudomonas entomophila TaxID=312306 RepID=UPI0023D87487|nr:sigma-70 family RNA polymerase sigma factor [Pseudomonas entomophila]MDF0731390.1 sigma-70 family RNA polymerase sigma factor [Pseudomonas entomophila]